MDSPSLGDAMREWPLKVFDFRAVKQHLHTVFQSHGSHTGGI